MIKWYKEYYNNERNSTYVYQNSNADVMCLKFLNTQPPKLILKPDGGCTSETDNCEGKCSGDESEARAQVLV